MRRKKNLIKRLSVTACAMAMILAMSLPVSAGNVSFAFNLKNTQKKYNTCEDGSNKKVYSGDSASVRIQSGYAPGYGFSFIMQYKFMLSYSSATVTSPRYWLSGAGIVHPAYASGQNKTNRYYYVAARIDDDYSGSYSCSGYFNSDYVN